MQCLPLPLTGHAGVMAACNSEPGVLTVWSDVACPWATLALHTLRERARAKNVVLHIDHRVFPLELVNSAATPQPMHDDEVERIIAILPSLGWQQWTQPAWQYPVTMLPAIQAVQAAKHMGLRASDALDGALRRAFFVEQRCVSLRHVIDDIAQDVPDIDASRLGALLDSGAGLDAISADRRELADGQVQGSPHIWTADGPYAANPGVDDVNEFTDYDASWADQLIAKVA